MEKKVVTRKELYELVCSKPLTQIAADLSVSAHGLRKICVEKNIPLPTNGHWSKVKYGKASVLQELPEGYSGSEDINLDGISVTAETDLPNCPLDKKAKEIEEAERILFRVPERLTNPDPLIISTMKFIDAIKRYDWRSNKPRPERINLLNIEVSNDCDSRAFRIMDTVIKVLRSRNHQINCGHFRSVVVAFGEEVEIRLREKNRVSKEKDRWGGRQIEATGKLMFTIGDSIHKKEIQDGLELLETKISKIITHIEEVAERERNWRIEAEEHRRQEEERRKIAQEIKQQKDKEALRMKKLFLGATRLHQTNIIRKYIKTIEAKAIENEQLTSELKDWIQWAIKKADWYDPLINGDDTLLDDVYKTNIFKEFLKEWQ